MGTTNPMQLLRSKVLTLVNPQPRMNCGEQLHIACARSIVEKILDLLGTSKKQIT